LGEDDFAAMEGAVRSGNITAGPCVREFEERFCRYLGAHGAVATNSCTSALVLALAAMEIGAGDEVAMPSYTCLAVANAVAQVGAKPRLADNVYDARSMDFNVSADSLAKILTPRTKAIVVPHMFGVSADMRKILALGVPVIEDITLSLGVHYGGRPIGLWGAMAVCSFHASKMMACGEGGMLVTGDADLYAKALYSNSWSDEQPAARMQETTEHFQLRYNFHMSDIAAALGMSQLRKLPAFLQRRRELAALYSQRLSTKASLCVPMVDERPNVFFRFMVALQDGDVRDVLAKFRAVGIEAGRGVYPPLHRFFACPAERFPQAEHAAQTLVSIPLYPNLSDEQVEYVLNRSGEIFSS
jgi:dTDP-4-amino-4,6-dideoxygalactose transaminase